MNNDEIQKKNMELQKEESNRVRKTSTCVCLANCATIATAICTLILAIATIQLVRVGKEQLNNLIETLKANYNETKSHHDEVEVTQFLKFEDDYTELRKGVYPNEDDRIVLMIYELGKQKFPNDRNTEGKNKWLLSEKQTFPIKMSDGDFIKIGDNDFHKIIDDRQYKESINRYWDYVFFRWFFLKGNQKSGTENTIKADYSELWNQHYHFSSAHSIDFYDAYRTCYYVQRLEGNFNKRFWPSGNPELRQKFQKDLIHSLIVLYWIYEDKEYYNYNTKQEWVFPRCLLPEVYKGGASLEREYREIDKEKIVKHIEIQKSNPQFSDFVQLPNQNQRISVKVKSSSSYMDNLYTGNSCLYSEQIMTVSVDLFQKIKDDNGSTLCKKINKQRTLKFVSPEYYYQEAKKRQEEKTKSGFQQKN